MALEHIFLHSTAQCNLQCLHCYGYYGPKQPQPDELFTPRIVQLLDEAQAINVKKFHLGGGEALLRKDIGEIITHCQNRPFKTSLVTNGLLINEKVLGHCQGKLEEINFSIDGANSDDHEFLRPRKGLFKTVVENLQRTLSFGFQVKVWCVVNRRNIFHVLELPELLYQLGVPEMCFLVCSLIGRAKDNRSLLEVDTETWLEFVRNVEKLRKDMEGKIKIHYEPAILEKEMFTSIIYSGCRGRIKNTCHIDPSGNVYFCLLLINTKYSLGNLRDASLEEIWTKSPRWGFWNQYFPTPKKECGNCKIASECHSGCPAIILSLRGNLDLKDPRCNGKLVPLCLEYMNISGGEPK